MRTGSALKLQTRLDAEEADEPRLASEEQQRRAQASLLRFVLLASLAVLVLIAGVAGLITPFRASLTRPYWGVLVANTTLVVGALVGIRLGHARKVAAVYCALQTAILAAIHLTLGIQAGVVAVAMLNTALLAGFTSGPTGGVTIAAFSAVWIPAALLAKHTMGLPLLGGEAQVPLVPAYAGTMVVSTVLIGHGLGRLRHHYAHAVDTQARLSERVRQGQAVAELSELIVRAPNLAELHRDVAERLASLVPDHDVAVYHMRRRKLQLSAATGSFRWPDRLQETGELLSPSDESGTAVSSVIRLNTGDLELGLPMGRSELVPIWLQGKLTGALATVAEPDASARAPVELLRTVANLMAAGHDRHSKDGELRQSQKMEAVGQLAGGVAHDFNNLLTSVMGSASLARERLDDHERVDRLLQDIERAGEHAAMLTRQMLTFSRRHAVRPGDVCVHEVIETLDNMVRRLLPETIELETKLVEQRGMVHADRHAIEQVIWNLVLNARDAIGERGKIQLGCAVDPGGSGFGTLHLTVADDGCGMDVETIEQIFEPFFTTKAVGQGTGLGLATVRRIVQDLGGEIDIDSTPGRGTRFTVSLPLSRAIGLAPAAPAKKARRSSFHPRARSGDCVLLVEDHELVRSSMRELLTNAGYKVIAVPDGQAALEELSRRDGISAVVSDVVMPRIGGDELVRVMRGRADDTPVVLLTGYADERLRAVDPSTLDGVPLLDKPVSPGDLLLTLRQLIDRRREQREHSYAGLSPSRVTRLPA